MKKSGWLLLLLAFMTAVIFAGCDPAQRSQDETPPEEPPPGTDGASGCLIAPDITGTVLEVDSSDGLTRVLVDSDSETVKGEIWVTIDENTGFFEDVDPDSSIGISNVSRDFQVGNRVAILSNGTIMESYPMKTTAAAVYQNDSE